MENLNKKMCEICEISNCTKYNNEYDMSGPEFGLVLFGIPIVVVATIIISMTIVIIAKKIRGF
jgi:hypothetical protein